VRQDKTAAVQTHSLAVDDPWLNETETERDGLDGRCTQQPLLGELSAGHDKVTCHVHTATASTPQQVNVINVGNKQ